jgi:exodeoxyribonuclease VII small subunit
MFFLACIIPANQQDAGMVDNRKGVFMNDQETTHPRLEDALHELERIVADIESGRVGLEEGVEKYQRGNELIRHCRQLLEKAERQLGETPSAPGE